MIERLKIINSQERMSELLNTTTTSADPTTTLYLKTLRTRWQEDVTLTVCTRNTADLVRHVACQRPPGQIKDTDYRRQMRWIQFTNSTTKEIERRSECELVFIRGGSCSHVENEYLTGSWFSHLQTDDSGKLWKKSARGENIETREDDWGCCSLGNRRWPFNYRSETRKHWMTCGSDTRC